MIIKWIDASIFNKCKFLISFHEHLNNVEAIIEKGTNYSCTKLCTKRYYCTVLLHLKDGSYFKKFFQQITFHFSHSREKRIKWFDETRIESAQCRSPPPLPSLPKIVQRNKYSKYEGNCSDDIMGALIRWMGGVLAQFMSSEEGISENSINHLIPCKVNIKTRTKFLSANRRATSFPG